MTVEPVIFFELTLTIVVLSIVLITVIFYFSRTIKKLTQGFGLPNQSQKNENLLNENHQKAIRIIDEANNKAIDILSKANLTTNKVSADFAQQIKRVASLQIRQFEKDSSSFMKIYGKVLQDLKSKNIEVFQNISKDIEVSTMGEIKNFKDSMEKLTVTSQQLVKKKIETDYKTAQEEVSVYKNEELKKIDNEIYSLLERVSKLALGKAMSLSEHEDLIQKSLEKAKEEGVFKS